MCGGRNPPNKNSPGFITALPDPRINGAVFLLPWFPVRNLQPRTTMSNNTTITADQSIQPTLAIRISFNPDHHIWLNNGTYWIHYTEHLPDYTKRRVRRSLHTDHPGIARVLRDTILHEATEGRSVYEEEVPRHPTAIAA
jgi:hypothetical protein